ncbi:MAG TPA: GntR family transcriptional regulator, partial [Bacteroidetes bacterium]|nr:GntR family transcriptional regulator [Bacteroidota bacterium]
MKILISNTSPNPIYEQIKSEIKRQIVKGDLSDGEALPSIRKLALDLQVSVITTKRA